MNKKGLIFLVSGVILLYLGWPYILMSLNYMRSIRIAGNLQYQPWDKFGQFGDSYGTLTSFFTLVALIGLIYQIKQSEKHHREDRKQEAEEHRIEIETQREQHRQSLEAQRNQHLEAMKEQRQLHSELMKDAQEKHEKEMIIQRMAFQGAIRPFVRLGKKAKIVVLRDDDINLRNWLGDVPLFCDEIVVDRAKAVIIVDLEIIEERLINCLLRIQFVGHVNGKTFNYFVASRLGCFLNINGDERSKRIGLLIDDIPSDGIATFECCECTVTFYYQNTVGGSFVVRTNGGNVTTGTPRESLFYFDDLNLIMRQIPECDYLLAVQESAKCICASCFIAENAPGALRL